MIRPEKAIREMLKILEFFGKPEAVQALKWTLNEYGPPEPPAHPEVSEQSSQDQPTLTLAERAAVEHVRRLLLNQPNAFSASIIGQACSALMRIAGFTPTDLPVQLFCPYCLDWRPIGAPAVCDKVECQTAKHEGEALYERLNALKGRLDAIKERASNA